MKCFASKYRYKAVLTVAAMLMTTLNIGGCRLMPHNAPPIEQTPIITEEAAALPEWPDDNVTVTQLPTSQPVFSAEPELTPIPVIPAPVVGTPWPGSPELALATLYHEAVYYIDELKENDAMSRYIAHATVAANIVLADDMLERDGVSSKTRKMFEQFRSGFEYLDNWMTGPEYEGAGSELFDKVIDTLTGAAEAYAQTAKAVGVMPVPYDGTAVTIPADLQPVMQALYDDAAFYVEGLTQEDVFTDFHPHFHWSTSMQHCLAHMERDDLSDAAHVMLVNFYMGFMCFGNQTHTLWGSHADRVFTNGALLFLGVAMEAYEASLPKQV